MNAGRPKSFRFANDAQWNTCLFVSAAHNQGGASTSFQPFPPFGHPGRLYESDGAHAPVITSSGEVLWVNNDNVLHRVSGCSDVPETFASPFHIPCARDESAKGRPFHVVATASVLWMADAASVSAYEEETFTRLVTVDLPGSTVIDIASDGDRCLLVLVLRGNTHVVVRVGPSGRAEDLVELGEISQVEAFVYLRSSKRYVVLAGKYPRLYWFSESGGRPFFSLSVPGIRPCFSATALGSNSLDIAFLAGAERGDLRGRGHVLLFDIDGNSLGDVPIESLDVPATGIVATRNTLFVTGSRGLLRFDETDVVPEGSKPLSMMVVTPTLFSADREDGRRWLRVEATANVPKGSTIELAWIATETPQPEPPANAGNNIIRVTEFVSSLLGEPGIVHGSSVFHGVEDSTEGDSRIFAAPLFELRKQPFVRILGTLTAASGGSLPVLSELNVFYPGRTLMESLPSIYQRDESRPNSFLRSLVGVLETTTQGIDANIGSMGSKIHPDTAPEKWLDFTARWLGLPWDDTLSLTQKQKLASGASQLAQARGTRAGLESLLESLIPGTSRRFRVTDTTADFGFAVVGGEAWGGSRLPAMLAAQPVSGPELGSRMTVLGRMQLAGPGQSEDDGVSQLAGNILVEVAATAAERKAWQPWLLSLITQMVPLTVRVELRWITKHDLRTDVLDENLKIESAPVPRLGTDAITNLARLPEGGTRLSATGANIETTLR